MRAISLIVSLIAVSLTFSCAQQKQKIENINTQQAGMPSGIEKIVKSEKEWKAQLTPQQYNILRKQGTEYAFSGKYWDNKEKGVYICAACELPLFDSETKFKSGTGWPSYYQPITPENVETETDKSFGIARVKIDKWSALPWTITFFIFFELNKFKNGPNTILVKSGKVVM